MIEGRGLCVGVAGANIDSPFGQNVHNLFSQNQRGIVNNISWLDPPLRDGELAIVSYLD